VVLERSRKAAFMKLHAVSPQILLHDVHSLCPIGAFKEGEAYEFTYRLGFKPFQAVFT
jgi:hypothetical protein